MKNEPEKKYLYGYSGGVLYYDKLVADKFVTSTYAVSEQRAAGNIEYQFKKQMGLLPSAKIRLDGKVFRKSNS